MNEGGGRGKAVPHCQMGALKPSKCRAGLCVHGHAAPPDHCHPLANGDGGTVNKVRTCNSGCSGYPNHSLGHLFLYCECNLPSSLSQRPPLLILLLCPKVITTTFTLKTFLALSMDALNYFRTNLDSNNMSNAPTLHSRAFELTHSGNLPLLLSPLCLAPPISQAPSHYHLMMMVQETISPVLPMCLILIVMVRQVVSH